MIRLLHGDCRGLMASLEPDSVDAVVVDPPYEIGFMGRSWDSSGIAFDPVTWKAAWRVLKPGGHMVAFGGTRTVHRIAVAIEDAGFEIRDTLHWCYWSGFPKSLDISKEMDRIEGAVREVIGLAHVDGTANPGMVYSGASDEPVYRTAASSPMAIKWDGFGTAVKPAIEPAMLARKPISESSIARNVLKWGTGALNIDGCRFKPGDTMWPGPQENDDTHRPGNQFRGHLFGDGVEGFGGGHEGGRFPANLLYCPKASRAERERGCDGLPVKTGAAAVNREEGSAGLTARAGAGRSADEVRNYHPTVKPVRLMQYLVRLVGCQPGSVILDPFMGSGTTGIAAVSQGYSFIGCELQPEYIRIARARIAYAAAGKHVDAPDIALEGVTNKRQMGFF